MGFPSPYEGAPDVEGILKGGLKDWQRGPDRADHQMKVSTTSINIVIIFRGLGLEHIEHIDWVSPLKTCETGFFF